MLVPSGSRNLCLWIGTTAIVLACLGVLPSPASAAAPAPTPARSGPPNSVALLGDSISAGTGTSGIPGTEQPANSWGTGTNGSVQSVYQRLVAINPAASGNNYNQASNGKKMTDMAGQATSMPASTELVLLQMGGNDLCKDTVAQMTSLADYRSQFVAGLNAIAARSPSALIAVSSVPDIYNLWFLRGAPNPPNSQPSSRAATARLFWDTLAVIPCKSLVDNPTDMSAGAIARREAVRQRDLDFNAILEEECALRLRCRFDNYATFDFSSNRPSRTSPDYLPRDQWQFVDDDISTIDHFHPSLSGQTKLARVAWEAGRNFSDSTVPAVTSSSITPMPLGSGTSVVPTTAAVTYSDVAGIRGIEWRTHRGVQTSAWNLSYSSSLSVPVSDTGVTYVETRAMDNNGNLTASRIATIDYDPNAIPAPSITSGPASLVNTDMASIQFSGEASLTFECSTDGSAFISCSSPSALTGLSDGGHSFSVRQTAGGGVNGPAASRNWTVDTTAPSPPALSGTPNPIGNSNLADFNFSGEAGAAFQCSTTGTSGPWSTCVSPRNLTGLADGVRSFSVRQTDPAGNTGAPASASWTIDTVAPFAPLVAGIPPAQTSSTSASVTFTGEALASFQCKLDSGSFAACTSPRQLASLEQGSHTFSVRQVDQAGNTGPAAVDTWTVDTSAPPAPAITGGPPAFTSSSSASITFSGEAGTSFSCSLDSAAFLSCTSPRNLSALAAGPHSLVVRQTDQAGNVSATATKAWTVDSSTSPPSITSQPLALTMATTASFAFTGEAGAIFKCSTGGTFQACTSPYQLNGLTDGLRTFAVTQTDLANNVSQLSSVTWTVDTTAPAAPDVNPVEDVSYPVRNHSIGFRGETGGRYECRADGGAWSPCSSPHSLAFTSDGLHNFEVRQIDGAGNSGAAAGASWRIDTLAPAAPVIDTSPSGLVRFTTATITMNGEAGTVFECRSSGGDWSGCSSPWLIGNLAQGAQVAEVRQLDEAGNSSPAAARQWTVDSVAPTAPVIGSSPAGLVRSVSATIAMQGEAGSTFECRASGVDWSSCTSPWSLDGLGQGGQSAEVRQLDQAGNVSPATSVTWTVDTIAPGLAGRSTVKKKKTGQWTLKTRFASAGGQPSKLEFSTAKSKPSATARPVSSRTGTWAAKLTLKSTKRITWVRVSDTAGNQSPWSPVR